MKKLKGFFVVLVAALLLALPAIAVNINTYDFAGRIIYNGLFVGTKTTAGTAANKTTTMLGGSVDYDFPPIGAAGDYAGCRDSFGFAVPEAKVGDPCMLGYLNPTPFDGGVTGQNFQASCSVVATGIIAIRGCCMQGDGGSCNVDDAGYSYRIISSQ
jgi:hypothetical protein